MRYQRRGWRLRKPTTWILRDQSWNPVVLFPPRPGYHLEPQFLSKRKASYQYYCVARELVIGQVLLSFSERVLLCNLRWSWTRSCLPSSASEYWDHRYECSANVDGFAPRSAAFPSPRLHGWGLVPAGWFPHSVFFNWIGWGTEQSSSGACSRVPVCLRQICSGWPQGQVMLPEFNPWLSEGIRALSRLLSCCSPRISNYLY